MAHYRPSSDVVSTRLDEEETVLLSLETQRYYSLNETGSRVWELLSDGQDVDAIATAITEEWDTTHEEALDYVRSFLDELNEEGLVERADGDAA
jgi:hypothetical protein